MLKLHKLIAHAGAVYIFGGLAGGGEGVKVAFKNILLSRTTKFGIWVGGLPQMTK